MNNPLSAEQQVRMQLAITYKLEDPAAMEKIYQWVMGSKSTIVPVSKFEVMK